MELRFTSGQICKIFGITKQTLLFYDKAGIIKPRYQDPDNRYRYYTLAQFDLLYLILSLRETGISLSEIKGLLAQRTVDHTIAILERQMGEIQNKIDSLQIAKGRLDKNLTQIKAIGGLKQDMLDIAYLPEQHLLAMPVQYANGSVDYDLTVSKLIAHMAACAIPFYWDIGSIITVDDQHKSKVASMFVVLEHVIADVYAKLKPAGDYLSIYHHGTYESLDDAYESLLCYMESNQLTKLGEFYESYIVNQLTTEDETSYITKISVAVAK